MTNLLGEYRKLKQEINQFTQKQEEIFIDENCAPKVLEIIKNNEGLQILTAIWDFKREIKEQIEEKEGKNDQGYVLFEDGALNDLFDEKFFDSAFFGDKIMREMGIFDEEKSHQERFLLALQAKLKVLGFVRMNSSRKKEENELGIKNYCKEILYMTSKAAINEIEKEEDTNERLNQIVRFIKEYMKLKPHRGIHIFPYREINKSASDMKLTVKEVFKAQIEGWKNYRKELKDRPDSPQKVITTAYLEAMFAMHNEEEAK